MSNKFTIGKDTKITFLVNGQPIGALELTNFNFKQMTKSLDSDPINGEPIYDEIEKGWEGDFDWDRRTPILDDFFAAKEAARYAGGPMPEMSITHRIRETDGSNSRYRFTGVAVKLDDGGSYKSDDKVSQKVSWRSARRLKV